MKSMMLKSVIGMGLIGGMALTVGCVGKGDTRYLDVRTPIAAVASQEQEPVKIVIEPFDAVTLIIGITPKLCVCDTTSCKNDFMLFS